MNPLKPGSGEIAARNPRLIGDQNQRDPRVPQQSKPLDRAWRKLDSVRVAQVDLVDDDGSISVNERQPPRRGRRLHELAPATRRIRAWVEMRSARTQTYRSSMSSTLDLHHLATRNAFIA